MKITHGIWPALLIANSAVQPATAQIQILALTDSATFSGQGHLAYGSLASVFCSGLKGIDGIVRAPGYPLPYEIAGVSVRLNGKPAPLLAIADLGDDRQQINIQVPGFDEGTLEVSQLDQVATIQHFRGPDWGIFFTDERGYVIAQHADHALVTTNDPAHEVITAFGTNLVAYNAAEVSKAPLLGYPSPDPPVTIGTYIQSAGATIRGPFLTVNGITADDQSVALVPGSVGVFQLSFRMPSSIPAQDLYLSVILSSCYQSTYPDPPRCGQDVSLGARIPFGTAPDEATHVNSAGIHHSRVAATAQLERPHRPRDAEFEVRQDLNGYADALLRRRGLKRCPAG